MENETKQNSGLATTSLVLGVISPLCCFFFTGIPAIVCGHMARGKIKNDSSLKGDGLAVAGLVLGYFSLVTTAIAMVLGLTLVKEGKGFMEVAVGITEAQKVQTAMEKMNQYPADAGITTVSQLKEQLIKANALTEEEIEELDFSQFLFGNVSGSDPATTVLIRAKRPGPSGVIFFLPKQGTLEAVAPQVGLSTEPPREPKYLSEE